ncbi:phytoene desaturase family protein [Gynuella sunshinyii]|uniref:Phytoene dehydrogenase-related protein n=1 Tax=Gynuella sunshinyii YC6258 TaxID=1445510 RepID=A0A0C5VLV6_9GAMM|nr:NAD(P)/FAD-dependent oxidoreductase [Gynuella sunshinyii]AJQ95251.1 phytoene dehydrogenase-related protein [Gynuella sunshinyii YC6258]
MSSHTEPRTERKSMLIIGGGLGGLSTGCYAQMNGYDAHILEMHEIPGGCCTAWEKGDFWFDWCISWLLGSGPGNEMYQIWREIGGLDGKEIRHPEIFNIVTTISGDEVRFYSDPDKLEKHLLDISPDDAKMIKQFCEGLRKFIRCLKVYPFLQPVGLMSVWQRAKMMASFVPYFNLIRKTITELMVDYSAKFTSPVLQEAFNFILYEKHPNFPVLPVYFQLASHATHSAGVPQGGSLALANSIAGRYERLGGQITYNAKVEEILVENDTAVGVRLSDGREYRADIIVSASDGYNTLMKLLKGQYMSDTFRRLYTETIKKPEMVFPGYLTVFLGLNRELPDMEYCTTYILPPEVAAKMPGMRHASINVQLRSGLYPELAPPGQTMLYVSYFCDIAPWRELTDGTEQVSRVKGGEEIHTLPLRRGRAYLSAKKQVMNHLIEFLEGYIPGLRDSVVVRDIATPMTQVRYTKNYDGSVLGWQPFVDGGETLEEEVKRNGPGIPGLKNFYFSGVWITTGGLIRAAASGRHVMQFICKDDNKAFQAHVEQGAEAPTHVVYPPRTEWQRNRIKGTVMGVTSRESSHDSVEEENILSAVEN